MGSPYLDGSILDPRLLRSIRNPTSPREMEIRIDHLRPEMHLSQQRHEQRSLPAAGGPNDEIDAAALEQELSVDFEKELVRRSGSIARCPGKGRVAKSDSRIVRFRD